MGIDTDFLAETVKADMYELSPVCLLGFFVLFVSGDVQ